MGCKNPAAFRYGRRMTDAPRHPQTTWEYCLSAADELVLWHVQQGGNVPVTERPRVVTLIGAAAYGLAASLSMEVHEIADLPLTGPDDADSRSRSMLGVLQHHAQAALQTGPYEDMGAEERKQLLAAYGSPAFDSVRETAIAVIVHHAQSAGRPHPTIEDRAPAMARRNA